MNDIEWFAAIVRCLVRSMKPGKHPGDHGEYDRERDGFFCGEGELEEVAERYAVDVLLNEDQFLAVDDDVEHRNDVRMMDPRGDARLVAEHLGELGIVN